MTGQSPCLIAGGRKKLPRGLCKVIPLPWAVPVHNDLVWDTSQADLIVRNEKKMIAMGATPAQAQALLNNKWFSLSVLTSLVTGLEQLGGIGGRPEVLALAATVENEDQARFLAASVQMLAQQAFTFPGWTVRQAPLPTGQR